MKYIDADRLRKELNKWRDVQPSTVGLPRKATYEAMGVIQTIDHVLDLIDSLQQEMWKPSYEQMKALEVAGKTFASFKELNMNTQRAWKIFHEPLESLGNDLAKLMKL